MYEFQWQLPTQQHSPVVLRVHARKDWFGIKTLEVDGRRIYRRFWLSGVGHRFPVGDGAIADLRLVETPDGQWRPALFLGGAEIPEQTGTAVPHVPRRPAIIGVVTGLTYLLMLVAVVMLLSITDLLETLRQPHAGRKYVLTVRDELLPELLTVAPKPASLVPQGESISRNLEARGGTPPYTWTPVERRWPHGMTLDAATGAIAFTPSNPNDYAADFTVTDARHDLAAGVVVVHVAPKKQSNPDWPTVVTTDLPEAVYGQPYDACLQIDKPGEFWEWSRLSGSLPKGLKITPQGCISGTPVRRELAVLPPTHAGTLHAGTVDPQLAADLLNAKIRMGNSLHLVVPQTNGDGVRILTDESRRWLLDIASDGVHVLDGGDQYGFSARVVDTRYSVGDDLNPWIFPFIATTISLLGYWNMRRWGVLVLWGLLAVQLVCLVTGIVPVAVTAIVLQGLIGLLGLSYLGMMR